MKTILSKFHVVDQGPFSTNPPRFIVEAEASDPNDTSRVASAFVASTFTRENAEMIVAALSGGPSAAEKDALGEILDLAYGDQESYLMIGNPKLDYGDEWPFTAQNKANTFRHIAAFAERIGFHGEKERWSGIADSFEASGKEYDENNPARQFKGAGLRDNNGRSVEEE